MSKFKAKMRGGPMDGFVSTFHLDSGKLPDTVTVLLPPKVPPFWIEDDSVLTVSERTETVTYRLYRAIPWMGLLPEYLYREG